MKLFSKFILLKKYNILIFCLSILSFFFRPFIPELVFLFTPLYAIFILCNIDKLSIKFIDKTLILISVMILFFLVGLILSNSLYIYSIKELINGIIVVSFFYFTKFLDPDILLKTVKKYVILFFVLLIMFFIYIQIFRYRQEPDLNVFAMYLLFAVLFTLTRLKKLTNQNKVFLYNIFLTALSVCIVLSRSRRGIIAFIILLVYWLVFEKSIWKVKYFLFLSIIFISTLILFFTISTTRRNSIANIIHSSQSNFKYYFAKGTQKYLSFFSPQSSGIDVYHSLFIPSFNKNDPETWLNGINYSYNKTTKVATINSLSSPVWTNNQMYVIPMIRVKPDSIGVMFSFDINVLDTLNIEYIRLVAEQKNMYSKYYYLDKAHENNWQQMEVFLSPEISNNPIYFNLEVKVSDSNGYNKGFIKIKNPKLSKTNIVSAKEFAQNPSYWADFNYAKKNKDTISVMHINNKFTSFYNNDSSSYGFTTLYFDSLTTPKDMKFELLCFVDTNFNGSEIYLGIYKKGNYVDINRYKLNKKGVWQKLRVNKTMLGNYRVSFVVKAPFKSFEKVKGSVSVFNPVVYENRFKLEHIPIQNFSTPETKRLDSDYRKTIDKLQKNGMKSTRTLRWKYALELWQTKYKWYNKLFGSGFDYLERYGKKFYNDKDFLDYPHNPIISAFLYSGILGGLFYIYFLIIVFYKYWKKRKHLKTLFIMYIITFFFMMFSGNSHFSVPIFTFLSIIPFLKTNYLK